MKSNTDPIEQLRKLVGQALEVCQEFTFAYHDDNGDVQKGDFAAILSAWEADKAIIEKLKGGFVSGLEAAKSRCEPDGTQFDSFDAGWNECAKTIRAGIDDLISKAKQ